MPKATFDNLPAEKRQRLIDIAIDEFAEHPYAAASVTRIVKKAGIAKGSLYQYFENKQDLFLYLLDYAARAQLDMLQALTPPGSETGFFESLRQQMSASVRVGAAEPRFVRLFYQAVSGNLPFREQAVTRIQATADDHVARLLRRGIARGELDPALDLELAAFVIKAMTANLGALIARRLGLDMQTASADVERMAGPEAEAIYDSVLRILRHGLAPRQ